MRKYICAGTCKQELPSAISLSNSFKKDVATRLKSRPWLAELEADRMAEQICAMMISKNQGFGQLMWEAGKALGHCESCWRDYCYKCFVKHKESD